MTPASRARASWPTRPQDAKPMRTVPSPPKEVRRDYGDDFEGARDPAQRAYDAAWITAYAECREFFEVATVALFTAYDAQKHPASVTAAALRASQGRDRR